MLNCKEAKKHVRKYIDDIITGKKTDFYTVETDVETAFGQFIPGKNFTFGNCQKLINMTVKYFYMVTYSDPTIRSHFNDCHCPMDNVMINMAITELKKSGETLANFNTTSANLRKSWSRIERNNHVQYDLFQAIVKYLAQQQGVNPIEYDYLMWK